MRGGSPLSTKSALQVVFKTALVVATLVGLYLLYVLRSLVLTLFLAIILASALRPIVSWLQLRLRLPRSVALLSIYGLTILAIIAALAAAVPSMISATMALMNRTAKVYSRWYDLALSLRTTVQATVNIALPIPPPQPEVMAWFAELVTGLQGLLPQFAVKLGVLLAQILFGMVIAYYWLEARDELLNYGEAVLPATYRARFLAVADEIERVLGAFLGGQLILSLLIGVATFLAFTLIGLPDAGALAFVGGLLHVIPLVGATIGAVPPILVGISISPAKGLVTAAVVLLIHQIENQLVAPRILQKRVGLSPLLVLVALAAGGALGGVVGALVAVPAAGTLWILLRHLLVEPTARRWQSRQQTGTLPQSESVWLEEELEQGEGAGSWG